MAATTSAINIPLSGRGQHSDVNTGDSDNESSGNNNQNRVSFGDLHRRISNNKVVTTEEDVCSSQSSSSPRRSTSIYSAPPLPTMMSSIRHYSEDDDNEHMIDSSARQIDTDDNSLVRPYDHSHARTEPVLPITKHDSKEFADNESKDHIENEGQQNVDDRSSIESDKKSDNDENPSEKLNIAKFPTAKLLEMLTALLDKIVKSNDRLADSNSSLNQGKELMNANNVYLNSVMSFRGKHIPQISLEHYFQRIQKYCPTTNDVFLSLLVYFDRISKRCNSSNNENANDNDLHYIPEKQQEQQHQQQAFVMDSHNIHRLLIAGVTVSTKFFSDFFYSNSRYARVGGISLQELNHLELQFLVLCDFELLISVNELQRYADLLYKFWNNSTVLEASPNVSET